MSGRVTHFEIPYDDGDRARSFYSSVFGWDAAELPGLDYTLVSTGPTGDTGPLEPGYIGGGMMKREGPFVSPNLMIDVENISQSLARVIDSGGTLVSDRTPVGDFGFVAYFRDTEGNLLGLWENAEQGD